MLMACLHLPPHTHSRFRVRFLHLRYLIRSVLHKVMRHDIPRPKVFDLQSIPNLVLSHIRINVHDVRFSTLKVPLTVLPSYRLPGIIRSRLSLKPLIRDRLFGSLFPPHIALRYLSLKSPRLYLQCFDLGYLTSIRRNKPYRNPLLQDESSYRPKLSFYRLRQR